MGQIRSSKAPRLPGRRRGAGRKVVDNDLEHVLPLLYQFARHLGAAPEDAEDVVHDALIRLLERGDVSPEARFSWLKRTIRSLWGDRNLTPEAAKRRKRRVPEPRILSLEEFDV